MDMKWIGHMDMKWTEQMDMKMDKANGQANGHFQEEVSEGVSRLSPSGLRRSNPRHKPRCLCPGLSASIALVEFVPRPTTNIADWLRLESSEESFPGLVGSGLASVWDNFCHGFAMAGDDKSVTVPHLSQDMRKLAVRLRRGNGLFHNVVIIPTFIEHDKIDVLAGQGPILRRDSRHFAVH